MSLQALSDIRSRLGLAVLLAIVSLSGRGLATPAADQPPPSACTFGEASPLFVPIPATLSGIRFDPGCQYVYLTNTLQNRVEIYSLQSQSFETPIPVGLSPVGLDVTPAGNLLYVANFGEHTISVIDLALRLELRKINVPFQQFFDDKPYHIAIGNAGKAIIASGASDSGLAAGIYDLTLANDQIGQRTDFGVFGPRTSNRTRLATSHDRSVIVAIEGNSSGGSTHVYRTQSDAFDPAFQLDDFVSDAALDRNGTRMLVTRGGCCSLTGAFVVDTGNAPVSMAGTMPVAQPALASGGAVHPVLPIGYRAVDNRIDLFDLTNFRKIGERSIVNSVSNATTFNFVGRMDTSRDGTVLGVLTNNGFTLIRPFAQAPEHVNLLQNGSFSAGLNGWTVLSSPGQLFLAGGVTAGVLEYNNVPGSQNVVSQHVNETFPVGAPLLARFRLGNSSNTDKTITIGLANGAGAGSRTCTFVVPAHSALATYSIVHRPVETWNALVASVRADTVGSDNGFNRVDNVSVSYDSNLSTSDGCSASLPPPPASCDTGVVSPVPVVAPGVFTGVLVDEGCRYVYLLNKDQNRVEVYSLLTHSFEDPILVGAEPSGVDVTLDGKTMYVANSGGNNVSVVELSQRVEDRRIRLSSELFNAGHNHTPRSVAILNNGRALVTAHMRCCTGVASVHELTLGTDGMVLRNSSLQFPFQPVLARVSGNRSSAVLLQANSNSGAVVTYSTSTETFSAPTNLNQIIHEGTLDRTGSRLLLQPGGLLVDSQLQPLGTFPAATSYGAALHPTQDLGYRSVGTTIQVLNTVTRTVIGTLPLGDSVSSASATNSIGRMDLSADGKVLAVITNNGFSIVRPFAAGPPPQFDLMRNGSFSSGTSAWQTFATPDPSYLTGGVTSGVFEFNRVTPPLGTANQALIFQETGVPLPAGAPIQAQFDLGNSSSIRKRISVLLIDANFSDISVCTFWLATNSPLATYRMLAHTTKPWSNAAIYFYAATDGADGGFNRVDNVALSFDPALPNDRVECDDPTTPAAPGGPDGPNLIGNGDFTTGALGPWLATDTLTWQLTGGVFEFVRPTPAVPAGVVLQPTGQGVNAGDLLTATFDLGNSSPTRKRVTVLLHDLDFSDLSACTFWLPAGQPLSAYSMRSFATKTWANATISIYAATVDSSPWAQLDNVTLRLTPGTAIEGTTCLEPDQGGAAPTTSMEASSSARSRSQSASRPDPAIATPPNDAVPSERGWTPWLDLSAGTTARVLLLAHLRDDDSFAEIQVSTDGIHWQAIHTLLPSDDWNALDLDLRAWLGQRIRMRLVIVRF